MRNPVTSSNRDTEVLNLPRPADSAEELGEALAAAGPRRWWNRTTLALLGIVLLSGGFLGGVQSHERWGGEGTQAAAGGESTQATGGGEPAAGAGGPSPAVGGAPAGPAVRSGGGAQAATAESPAGTTGTVKLVDGTTLYLETADGATVTVRTSGDTAVKVSRPATLESITSGLAVTVEGVPDEEGVITATTVTAG
jgi:hypothetical protein